MSWVSMSNRVVTGSTTHCGVLSCTQLRQVLCIVEPDLVTPNLGVDCSIRAVKIKEAERWNEVKVSTPSHSLDQTAPRTTQQREYDRLTVT